VVNFHHFVKKKKVGGGVNNINKGLKNKPKVARFLNLNKKKMAGFLP